MTLMTTRDVCRRLIRRGTVSSPVRVAGPSNPPDPTMTKSFYPAKNYQIVSSSTFSTELDIFTRYEYVYATASEWIGSLNTDQS